MAHRKHVKGQIVLSRPPSQHLDSLTEELPSNEDFVMGICRSKEETKTEAGHSLVCQDRGNDDAGSRQMGDVRKAPQSGDSLPYISPAESEMSTSGKKPMIVNPPSAPQAGNSLYYQPPVDSIPVAYSSAPQAGDSLLYRPPSPTRQITVPSFSAPQAGDSLQYYPPPNQARQITVPSSSAPQAGDSLLYQPQSITEPMQITYSNAPQAGDSIVYQPPSLNEVRQVTVSSAPQAGDSLLYQPPTSNDNRLSFSCAPQAGNSIPYQSPSQNETKQIFAPTGPPQAGDSLLYITPNETKQAVYVCNPPQAGDSIPYQHQNQFQNNQATSSKAPQHGDSLLEQFNRMHIGDKPESRKPPIAGDSIPCQKIQEPYVDIKLEEDFVCIKVSNFMPNQSESNIRSYFENRIIGGGPIQNMIVKDGFYYITFQSSEVARSICQRPSASHVLNGKQLKIIPMERPTAASSCGVMVKGIVAEKHTKDYISLFFEKGGKSVEDVYLDYANSLAVVTYQNPNEIQLASPVETLEMSETKVKVSRLEPRYPPRFHFEPTEKLCYMAKFLPRDAKLRDLQKYLETVAPLESWTRLSSKTGMKAVLKFSTQPNYRALRECVALKPFQGKMISIGRIPQTSSIKVHPVGERMPQELLEFYFENSRRSGGGEFKKAIKKDSSKDYALITFVDASVIPKVLAKQHVLDGQTLHVEPYFLFLEKQLPPNDDQDMPILKLLEKEESSHSISSSERSGDFVAPKSKSPFSSYEMVERDGELKTEIMTSLQRHQRMILKAKKYDQELMNKFRGLSVTISPTEITLVGCEDDIQKSMLVLYERSSKIKGKNLNLRDVAAVLVAKEPVQNYLSDVCLKNGICISWGEDVGTVYAFDKEDLEKAEKLIKAEVLVYTIPVQDFQVEFIEGKSKDIFRVISEDIELNRGHVAKIGTAFVITAFGSNKEMTSAEKQLRDLINSIVKEQKTFDYPGIRKYFQSNTGSNALLGIQTKCDVIIKHVERHVTALPGATASGQSQAGATSPANSIKTVNGVRVTLTNESLQNLKVDALVNSTSTTFQLEGGQISGSLLEKAGPEMQQELRKKGQIKFGEIVSTNGFKLPCKKVYHGAAMAWDAKNPKECTKVLKTFVANSLNRAHEDKLDSIAFPAIGTGKLQFPSSVVAQAMFEEVENFSRSYPRTSLNDILFSTREPIVVNDFQRELQDVLRKNGTVWRSLGSRRQLQIYKVYVNVVVVARSQSSVENAFKEIEQLCKEIVKTDSLPDTKQNRKYLENLTDQQVGDIENLQQVYSVEIVLEPPMSSKKLTVRGLAEDRRDVLRALPGILK